MSRKPELRNNDNLFTGEELRYKEFMIKHAEDMINCFEKTRGLVKDENKEIPLVLVGRLKSEVNELSNEVFEYKEVPDLFLIQYGLHKEGTLHLKESIDLLVRIVSEGYNAEELEQFACLSEKGINMINRSCTESQAILKKVMDSAE